METDTYEPQQLNCIRCFREFTWTVRDQAYYAERGFRPPKRCHICRAEKKAEIAKAENTEPHWHTMKWKRRG
jgi:hypothetical protein